MEFFTFYFSSYDSGLSAYVYKLKGVNLLDF